MKSALTNLKDALQSIEAALRVSPSFLTDGGKGVDDPAYFNESQQLEALKARLSVAIKELQMRPEPQGPKTLDLLKYAKLVEAEMKRTWTQAETRNVQEILADAADKLHEYHEMTAVPAELAYVPPSRPDMTYSIEALSIFLFSVIARHIQLRARRKKK